MSCREKNMNQKITALVCLALAGCSSLSYQEPVSGERARVRFATRTDNVVLVRGYDDASCSVNEQEWMRLRNGTFLNSSPKRMGMPLWRFHQNGAKELYVDATRPFHGLITSGESDSQYQFSISYRCGVALSFQFKPGLDYEVEYVYDRHACKVSVSQITGPVRSETLTPLATFTNRADTQHAGCLRDFGGGTASPEGGVLMRTEKIFLLPPAYTPKECCDANWR